MTDVFDYLRWRGDLSFSRDPLNAVDAMIFACLSYVRLSDLVPSGEERFTLRYAAQRVLEGENSDKRGRTANDIRLLQSAAETVRFGNVKLMHLREQFLPEQDTQFAAITFALDDGSLMAAFRGTDSSLVGWKEDFQMCCRQTIAAQRRALDYLHMLQSLHMEPLRVCGHSKGGNLAVFAAVRSAPMHRDRIHAVYNFDGPGFSDYLMGDPGYLSMVPKIHSFVPQTSIIGMIMEHEEPYTIVHSSQFGIAQHDSLTWEILGTDYVTEKQLTGESVFIRQTIQNWLEGMNNQQRTRMVDTLFDLLQTGDVNDVSQMLNVKTIRNYLRVIGIQEETRHTLASDLLGLLRAAKRARHQLGRSVLLPGEDADNR